MILQSSKFKTKKVGRYSFYIETTNPLGCSIMKSVKMNAKFRKEWMDVIRANALLLLKILLERFSMIASIEFNIIFKTISRLIVYHDQIEKASPVNDCSSHLGIKWIFNPA